MEQLHQMNYWTWWRYYINTQSYGQLTHLFETTGLQKVFATCVRDTISPGSASPCKPGLFCVSDIPETWRKPRRFQNASEESLPLNHCITCLALSNFFRAEATIQLNIYFSSIIINFEIMCKVLWPIGCSAL